MMPSGHQLREAQREPTGGQIAGAGAPSGSSLAAHAGMHEAAADARPTVGKAPVRRRDVRMPPLRLSVDDMEAARGRRLGSQPPQLEQKDTATPTAEHQTGGSIGVSLGRSWNQHACTLRNVDGATALMAACFEGPALCVCLAAARARY
jgi:hypothetical protein